MGQSPTISELCRALPPNDLVSNSFATLDVVAVDLNGDGKKDEYVAIRRKSLTHCGRIEKDPIIDQLRADFGNYTNRSQPPGSNVMSIAGTFWQARITWDPSSTTIVTEGAVPLPPSIEKMGLKTKSPGKLVHVGDPVSTGDGQTYFVTGFDLSEAVAYDGTTVTTAPDTIRLVVLTKDALMRLKKAKTPQEAAQITQEAKKISPSEITAVLSRDKFPEVYRK